MTQDNIVLLCTFDNMLQASLALDKLRSNGIDAFIEDENVIGLDPLGGVELKIFHKDKENAERLIAQ